MEQSNFMRLTKSNFFGFHPVSYPFPQVLRKLGFNVVFKPRDFKFREYLNLVDFKKKQNVLDVGCGSGVFIDRIVTTWGVKGYGVDIAKKSVNNAKRHSLNKIVYQVSTAAKLPYPDAFFDVVLCFDTLEHILLKDQPRVTGELLRVLKRRGKLLIYTINKNQKFTWNHLVQKTGIDILSDYDHDPLLFLDPSAVGSWLTKQGAKLQKVELFNAFYTLALDELIMVFCKLVAKLPSSESIAKTVLILLNFVSRIAIGPLTFLEKPWYMAKKSNSFFIYATKVEKK